MKRFLFLFIATLFALSTWAYGFSDESGGTTFYCNIVDDVAMTAEIAPDNFQYAATQSYCIDELVVPETVGGYTIIGIGNDAFDYCTFKAVSLPSTLQYIRDSGFWYCTNLEEIDIPEGVTVIESSAFTSCTALTTVNIPSTVTEIGSQAFAYDTALSDITCLATNPPSCAGAFIGVTTSGVNLYVPSECVGAYQSHTVWGGFNVQAIGSGGTSGGGDHEGDYLTPEIMGFDTSDTSQQDITYTGAPSGTEYRALCHLGSGTYEGDFNLSSSSGKAFIWSSSSVGYLRKVTIEGDENDTSGAYLSVRASSEAFDGSSFSAFSSYGDELAQISPKDGGSVESSGDYKYFAVGFVNSWDSAKRFKAIELVWETEGGGDTGDSGDHEYSIEPDPDVEQSSLQVFTLSTPDGVCADEYGSDEYDFTVYLYKDGASEPYASTSNIDSTFDTSVTWNGDCELIFTFESEITESGEYEFVIPANSFYWVINDGYDMELNDEMRFSYTVTGGTSGGGDHANDYLTPEIMGFDLSSTSKQEITYTGPSGTEYYANTYIRATSADSYVGDFNFSGSSYSCSLKNTSSVGYLRKLTVEADETLTSGSGLLIVRGSDSPYTGSSRTDFSSYGTEIGSIPVVGGGTLEPTENYKYFVLSGDGTGNYEAKAIELVWETEGGGDTGGVPDGYIIDPAEGEVPSLSVITIDSEDGIGEGSGFYSDDTKALFKVVNDETNETVATLGSWEIMMDDDTYHTWVEITLSNEVSEAGLYTVTIPEGAILDKTTYDPNPTFTLSYTVTGGTSGGGDHENDYLTPEIMGFDMTDSGHQKVTYTGAPSGTEYYAYAYVRMSDVDYAGDFNFSGSNYASYLQNTTSVGYLRKVTVEADETLTSGSGMLVVRGSDEAYSGSSFASYGTEIGSIPVVGGGTLEITDNYKYFALAGDGLGNYEAKAIELVWETEGGGDTGGGTFAYTVDPVEGEVTDLSDVTISFEDGVQLNASESAWGNAKLYNESSEPVAEVILCTPQGTYGQTYTGYKFTLGEDGSGMTITEPGEYDFVIPAGYMSFYDTNSEDWVECEEIKVHYVISSRGDTGGGSGTFSYTVDPANGEIVGQLDNITFYNDYGIYFNDRSENGYEGDPIVVYDSADSPVSYISDIYYIEDTDGTEIGQRVELYPVVTEVGDYKVVVPASFFYAYDENGNKSFNDEIALTYTIQEGAGGGTDYEIVASPASGETLESLSTISLTCEDGIMWNTLGWGDIVIYDGEDNPLDVGIDYEEVIGSTGIITEVILTISPTITTEGEYRVEIPEGYFLIAGSVESQAITLKYTIGTPTGIGGISINSENVEGIYSTSGQKLNTTTKGVNIVLYKDGTTKKILIK